MPSPTSMNPYPLAALNHLTLPSGITNLLLRKPQPGSRASCDGTECPAKATILRPSRSRVLQELCQKGGSSGPGRKILEKFLCEPCRHAELAIFRSPRTATARGPSVV